MVRAAIERLGATATRGVHELGRMAAFGGATATGWARPSFWLLPRLVREIYDTGVLSLPIVCLSGLTVGSVLGLPPFWVLTPFGAETSSAA